MNPQIIIVESPVVSRWSTLQVPSRLKPAISVLYRELTFSTWHLFIDINQRFKVFVFFFSQMEKVIKKNELLTDELADVKDQNAKVTQQNFKLSFILFSLGDTQFYEPC